MVIEAPPLATANKKRVIIKGEVLVSERRPSIS